MASVKLTSWLLLASGLITLIAAIIYESSFPALVGLSLFFWGVLLLYTSPEKYVKQSLLNPTIIPSLSNLEHILAELKFQGKGIYLPPKYSKDLETCKILISRNKTATLPTPEEIQQEEDKIFPTNPSVALINPPGLALSKLFEKTLGTDFNKVDLVYLKQNLPRLLTEDLEIAEDLEILTRQNKQDAGKTNASPLIKTSHGALQVKMTNSIYRDACIETRKLSRLSSAIGCPLCSAIACALAKATGKPVLIDKTEATKDGKTIKATFEFLEPTVLKDQAEIILEQVKLLVRRERIRLLWTIASLLPVVFGVIVAAWVGWLIWYDITYWNKNIIQILLQSRTSENYSLGMDLRIIHYLLIGWVLLLSGSIAFLLRRRREQ